MDTSLISSLWYVTLFVAVLAGLRLVLDRTHILARLARKPRSTIPSKKQSSYKDVLPPQPYDGFDIDKALPRSYRPFRWAYHQTMCMSPLQQSKRKTIHRTKTCIRNRKDGHRLVDRAREYLQTTTRPTQGTIRHARKESPRLPLSAAVVFNFKAVFTPVTEFRDEPGVPGLVAKVLKEGKKSLMEHKGTWHVEHVVLPEMEEWEREQRGNGLVPRDWQVATLDESPYFRGWEEKWHRQQGF